MYWYRKSPDPPMHGEVSVQGKGVGGGAGVGGGVCGLNAEHAGSAVLQPVVVSERALGVNVWPLPHQQLLDDSEWSHIWHVELPAHDALQAVAVLKEPAKWKLLVSLLLRQPSFVQML